MYKLILPSLRIQFSITANRLIHFLRSIPFIKRVIPKSIYGDSSLKIACTIAGFLLIFIKKMVFRFILVGLIVLFGLVLWLVTSTGGLEGFFQFIGSETSTLPNPTIEGMIPFILTVWIVFSLFGSSRIINIKANDEIMVSYMRANPTLYAKTIILLDRIIDLAYYLPFFILVIILSQYRFWVIFEMISLYTVLHLMCEAIELIFFQWTKKTFHVIFQISLVLVCLVSLFAPAYLGIPNWTFLLTNPFVFLGTLLIGALLTIYIMRYSLYPAFLRDRFRLLNEMTEKLQKNKQKKNLDLFSAKSWNTDVKAEDIQSNQYENKSGFTYLNAIFFDRHRKYFQKKMNNRCITILALGALITLFGIGYLVYYKKPFVTEMGIAAFFNNASIYMFVIYIISMGRVVTASVFSNCDVEMLHYSYYRTKENIFSSFKARFIYILRFNLIISTLLTISSLAGIGAVFGKMDYLYAFAFFILLTCIGVFFAFTDLFLYYVIQPYNYKGETKSFIYNVINGVIYFISYISFTSSGNFPFIPYTITAFIIVVLYIGIGMGALLLFAPKNFKLRQ